MSSIHPTILEIVNDDRGFDPWGSAMNALGALCDVMSGYVGIDPNTIADVGYRPGMSGPVLAYNPDSGEGYWTSEIIAMLDSGDLFVCEIEHAIAIIDRYADMVRAAGRDY